MGRVKDTYITDQEFELNEPDYDYDYELHIAEQEEELHMQYQNIFDSGAHCVGCIHNELTTDAYGTGDSPTMRECNVKQILDCPGMSR